jgi:hypothetical protein
MESADALCQPKSRRRSNGSGAAHHHVADGAGGFAEIARGEDAEFMRKQALLDEQESVSFRVKRHGSIVLSVAVKLDEHFVKTVAGVIRIRDT